MTAWPQVPLRRVLVRNDGGVWGDEPTGQDDTVVLRSTDIGLGGEWTTAHPAMRSLSKRDRDHFALLEGDLVVVKSSGSEDHIGKAALVGSVVAAGRPAFANFVQRLRLTRAYYARFGWYVINSTHTKMQLKLMGTTSTGLRNLSAESLSSIVVPLPPITAQRAIADFLDRETMRIDALIVAKRRMIELLDERFAVLIESAMVATSAAQKCGLGRFLATRITDGPHETPIFLDTGVPFVSIEAIVGNHIDFERCRYISEESHREYSRKCRPQRGDVLLAKTGATIGKTAIVDCDLEFDIWSPLALLRPRNLAIRPEYLWFCLRSRSVQEQIRLAATQSTQPNIAMGDIAALRVSVPDVKHQDEILSRLKAGDSQLQDMQSRLRATITLLQERRLVLITAAVTGEMTVRGVVL